MEKMLVTSIFFFSHYDFYRIKNKFHHLSHIQIVICKCFKFWIGLKVVVNLFPNKPLFLLVCSTNLFKTLYEKEKLLVTRKFLLYPQCFLPFSSNEKFYTFHQFYNFRLQTLSLWKSLKFIA